MTDTIDKRIVEMAFENSKFETGVGTSLSSIDKLKRALNFGDAGKSFGSITDAANRVHLGSIADGIQSLSSKFSALGIIGVTALVNIANAAFQTGARLVSALTIDPIRTGLNEYETKLNSVQTILANTQKEGTNLATVTDALNTLNTYSDKTIYNFQQMARNIGTFTAAGVKLDDSVNAIKGIANLAAISGSNADQASTAMYQLSQALSTGTVRLMDWNSVVNAGMGGQVFQDAVMETARVHGVAIDQIIEEEGSFRDSLQRGWFSSEILTETLSKFTGDLNQEQLRTMGYTEDQIKGIIKMGQTANDAATKVKTFSQLFTTLQEAAQSGWAQSWEIIIGDFEEAKSFLTDLNNWMGGMIGAAAQARNELLEGWSDLGGRTRLIEAFQHAMNSILAIVNPIREAFREFFPPTTAQQLFNLTDSIATFMEKIKMAAEGTDKIKRIFSGIFAILDIGRMAIVAVGNAFFGLTGSLAPSIGNLTEFLAKFGDWAVNLRNGIKSTDAFTKAIDKFKDAFQNVRKFIAPIIEKIGSFFTRLLNGVDSLKGIDTTGITGFFKTLGERLQPLGRIGEIAGKALGIIGTLLEKLAPFMLTLGAKAGDGISEFLDSIGEGISNIDYDKLFDGINTGLLAALVLSIKKFIDKGSGAFGGIADLLTGVKDSLKAWQADLKADVLLKIAGALAILTAAVLVLSLIDSKKLTGALAAMTVMFAQLGISLLAFQKLTSTVNPIQMTAMAIGLLAISSAMLLLAIAMSKLGKLDSSQLLKGVLALSVLIALSKVAAATLKGTSAGMITGALALIVFSVAIRSLGSAVEKLGEINTGVLIQGLIGVGVLMTELAIFMKAIDLSGMGALKAVGILVLAGAINLLAIAVSKMGGMDASKITQGLTAMGVIFTELAAFILVVNGAPGLILVAGGVAVLSASMLLMAEALVKLGDQSWDSVAKGLVSMGVALTLIGLAAYLIPPTLIITAAGLVVMAGALVILSKAMVTMGGMSWDEVGRGLGVLAGSLVILTLAMTAMSGTLAGSAALLVAAAAVAVLAPAMKTLGSLSLDEIGKALLALAGVFVVLGVAGAIMTPVIPTLVSLGVAMLLIGVATSLAGIGILAFSAGLAALAVSGAAGAAALVIVVTSIVSLIPMLVKQLGKALLILVDVLVAGAPKLLEGVVTLLTILLDGLLEVGPKIIETVLTIVESLLVALSEKTPTFIEAGYSILINFLKGLRDNIGEVTTVSIDIITAYLEAIASGIPQIVESGWNLMISFIDGMKESVEEHMPELVESVRELGFAIVKGVLTGLVDGHADAKAGIKELGQILIDGFKENLGIHSPSSVFMALALDIISGLAQGLRNNVMLAITEITKLATRIIDALKGKYSSMVAAGKDLISGLAQGIKGQITTAVNAAAELAKQVLAKIKAVLGIHSPSEETFEAGMFIDRGLAGGILKFANVVLDATDELGSKALSGFNNIVTKISDTLNSNMDFSPSIRPVVDLSGIEQGSQLANKLLSDSKFNMSLAAKKASSAMVTASTDTSGLVPTVGATTVSLTQNNYSPKELSRIDIYRQTRNQLLQTKGLVGAL